jgi:hypothetical protein
VDPIDGLKKKSLWFNVKTLGEEVAKAACWNAYVAAIDFTLPMGEFGCGVINDKGFHGDERHRFHEHGFDHMLAHAGAHRWNARTDTFCPGWLFCNNCHQLGPPNDEGKRVWLCLGHKHITQETTSSRRSDIVYADDTRTTWSLTQLADQALDAVKQTISRKKMPTKGEKPKVAPIQWGLGYDKIITPETPLQEKALVALQRMFIVFAKPNDLFSSIMVLHDLQKFRVQGNNVTKWVYIWPRSQVTDGNTEYRVVTEQATPFHILPKEGIAVSVPPGKVLETSKQVIMAVFMDRTREVTAPFEEKLIQLGFRVSNTQHILNGMMVEHEKLKLLYHTCKESRAPYFVQQKLEMKPPPDIKIVERELAAVLNSVEKARGAIAARHDYRLRDGLLQIRQFDGTVGRKEWYTLVPDGVWKANEEAGRYRPMTLRKRVLILFHHTYFGAHRGVEGTLQAVRDAGLYWKAMRYDMNQVMKACNLCTPDNAEQLVTGAMRTRDLYGPFRELEIDYIENITPESSIGYKYIFTCICPFSSFCWFIPTHTNTAEELADVLVTRVFFDMAGTSPIISSDRGSAFTSPLIEEINRTFGIVHVLGSSYHPQTRGHIERAHRNVNAMLRKLAEDEGDEWHKIIPYAQWSSRVTPRPTLGGYSPYEIVTGLKPLTPMDTLLHPRPHDRVSVNEYIIDLVRYLKQAHQAVRRQISEDRAAAQSRKYEEVGEGSDLTEGDYVMIRRPIGGIREGDQYVSRRLRGKTYNDVYEVTKVLDRSAVLASVDTGSTELPFSNPVSRDRLVKISVFPTVPYEREQRGIVIDDRPGTIMGMTFDGHTSVRFDDDPENPQLVDLQRTNYTLFSK